MVEEKAYIYLYDMPAQVVTSERIAEIIKRECDGYELKEPV
jgi:hypothetical protein